MNADLKGLNSFRDKLKKYSNVNARFTNKVATEIAKRGVDIATEEYVGISNVNISHQSIGSGMSKIIAEKKGLSYIEFGTGRVGEQSNYPEANLPKQGVPITGDWEYYYPSEHKITKDGAEGWMLGSNFVKGQPAGMQMYHTSQRLKNEMVNIVKNKIIGDGTNV